MDLLTPDEYVAFLAAAERLRRDRAFKRERVEAWRKWCREWKKKKLK